MAIDSGSLDLYVANAGSDNVSAYTIDANTGALTALPGSPYCQRASARRRLLLISRWRHRLRGEPRRLERHFGILLLRPDPSARIAVSRGRQPAQSGARGRRGNFLYSANPDATNPSISGFSVDPTTGALSPLSGSPFPLPVSHYIATDQTGAYLYVTSGANIVGYGIDVDHRCAYCAAGIPGCRRRERLFDNHRSDQPVSLCRQRRRGEC